MLMGWQCANLKDMDSSSAVGHAEYRVSTSPFARSVTRRNHYGQTEHYRMYRDMWTLSLTPKGADILKQKGGA